MYSIVTLGPVLVALYMSAWIEIKIIQVFMEQPQVALYMSAWIEIHKTETQELTKTVALYMSAWIEIVNFVITRRYNRSHST